jgi:hypothetical protein
MRRVLAFFSVVLLASTLVLAGTSIPKGTKIPVRFQDSISSSNARVGDTVYALLARELAISGEHKMPAGTIVQGRVTRAERASSDGTTPGTIAVVLESISDGDVRYVFATRELYRRGRPIDGKNTRDPNRSREIANTIQDTLNGIAHPDPRDTPNADGGVHVGVDVQSVEATIPAGFQFVFITTSSAAAMGKH